MSSNQTDSFGYKFDGLEISSPREGVRTANLQFGRASIEFQLSPDADKQRTTFPLIKKPHSECDDVIEGKTSKPDTDRQILFENIIRILAALHPLGMVPKKFKDRYFNEYQLDKTCAEWAADSSKFDRVSDAKGRHYLKPRL